MPTNKKLEKRIKQFNKSLIAFNKVETALNEVVSEEMNWRNTVEELYDLVDMLNPHYKGCRRIYEKVERLYNNAIYERKI